VDESAAKLKMEITSKPQHLDEIDRKILQLEMERLSLAKVILLPARQLHSYEATMIAPRRK